VQAALFFAAVVIAQSQSVALPIEAAWPKGVAMPEGLKFYQKTKLTQNLSITNGMDSLLFYSLDRDDVFTNAPTRVNPNRIFPWAVSGGLHEAHGWTSKTAVSFPSAKPIIYWKERIDAGAVRRLPKYNWEYPVGTVFADLLFSEGRLFELRTLTKEAQGWKTRVPFAAADLAPKGYGGPGKACSACHDHAGGWLEYGSLIRGGDNIFSFPMLEALLWPDSSESKQWLIKSWMD
jgi:hypothetical protein